MATEEEAQTSTTAEGGASSDATTPLLTDDDGDNNQDTPINNGDSDGQSSFRSSCQRWLSLFLSPIIDEQGDALSIATGLASIAFFGVVLGLVLPVSSQFSSHAYAILSNCLGYSYFFAWSVSFYPQLLTNFRRKTTAGLSLEFCSLNVLGFACYAVYNVTLYWIPKVQRLYRERYGEDAAIPVQSNDVAFAVHAFTLSLLTLLQILYYDGIHSQPPMLLPIKALIATILSICIFGAVLSALDTPFMNWLDYVYVLSLCKIAVTSVKYMPQVYLNWKRQSTVGWSIWQILLDLTGGLLSNLQLVLDCTALKDFSGITGNVAKLVLGQASVLFDIIFCSQHYCLYPSTAASDALLSETERFQEAGDENAHEVLSTLT